MFWEVAGEGAWENSGESLVQPFISYEVRPGCSGLYLVRSWKPLSRKTAQDQLCTMKPCPTESMPCSRACSPDWACSLLPSARGQTILQLQICQWWESSSSCQKPQHPALLVVEVSSEQSLWLLFLLCIIGVQALIFAASLWRSCQSLFHHPLCYAAFSPPRTAP